MVADMLFSAEPLASTPQARTVKKKGRVLHKAKRERVRRLMRYLRSVNNMDTDERIRAEKGDYPPWQFSNTPYVKGCLNSLIDRCEAALKE